MLLWYLRPVSCLLSTVRLTWRLEPALLVIEITPVLQISSKDEDFLDLSVDVEQNTSITHCLRGFSNTETLCSEYKYYCEECRSKQEAHKRMKVKKLPMILALHLKRFKYMDQLHRYTKLSYRVVFPLELRLFNTSGDATNPDRMYDLVAVVVHCGR